MRPIPSEHRSRSNFSNHWTQSRGFLFLVVVRFPESGVEIFARPPANLPYKKRLDRNQVLIDQRFRARKLRRIVSISKKSESFEACCPRVERESVRRILEPIITVRIKPSPAVAG